MSKMERILHKLREVSAVLQHARLSVRDLHILKPRSDVGLHQVVRVIRGNSSPFRGRGSPKSRQEVGSLQILSIIIPSFRRPYCTFRAHIYIYMYIYIYIYKYVYMYTTRNINMYKHTNKYTNMFICIYIYTHTFLYNSLRKLERLQLPPEAQVLNSRLRTLKCPTAGCSETSPAFHGFQSRKNTLYRPSEP